MEEGRGAKHEVPGWLVSVNAPVSIESRCVAKPAHVHGVMYIVEEGNPVWRIIS